MGLEQSRISRRCLSLVLAAEFARDMMPFECEDPV